MIQLLRATSWAAAGLGIAAAWADEPPKLAPRQDVKIEYQTWYGGSGSAGQPSGTLTEYIKAGGEAFRMEPGFGMSLLFDARSKRGFAVFDYDRSYWVPPSPPELPSVRPADGEKWTKDGKETIAGQDCTHWSVEIRGEAYSFCTTDDGVDLRSTGADNAQMQATAITYGAVPDALFRVPEGYRETPVIPHFPLGAPPGKQSGP